MAVKVKEIGRSLKSIREEKKLRDVMRELRESEAPFDLNLEIQVEDICDDFDARVGEWGKAVKEKFYNTAPYMTGNLRESIDIDDTELPKELFVGIMFDKLKGPKTLPIIRGERKGKNAYIPPYDYTPAANEKNVSANNGVGGPFIEEVWFAFAQAEARRLF